MKTIQFSTVEKQCNVEIIELNTYIIARAIKAQLKMHNALEGTKSPVYEKDTDGNTGIDLYCSGQQQHKNAIP